MPQLNGIDTTQRIRQLEAGQSGTPGRRSWRSTANTLVEDRYGLFRSRHGRIFDQEPLDRDKLAEALAGPRSVTAQSRRENVGWAKRSVPTILT